MINQSYRSDQSFRDLVTDASSGQKLKVVDALQHEILLNDLFNLEKVNLWNLLWAAVCAFSARPPGNTFQARDKSMRELLRIVITSISAGNAMCSLFFYASVFFMRQLFQVLLNDLLGFSLGLGLGLG